MFENSVGNTVNTGSSFSWSGVRNLVRPERRAVLASDLSNGWAHDGRLRCETGHNLD